MKFESVMRELGAADLLERTDRGCYYNPAVALAWKAWQAKKED